MKKIILLGIMFLFVTSSWAAQETANPATAATTDILTINGKIIDKQNAKLEKDLDLDSYVKTYTKTTALKREAVAVGYSLYGNKKLYNFDKASTAKIVEFLKKNNSDLQVTVKTKISGEELSLVSIENKK